MDSNNTGVGKGQNSDVLAVLWLSAYTVIRNTRDLALPDMWTFFLS